MSTKKIRGRGRPARFTGKKLRHVESLLRQHGPTRAREIIGAKKRSKDAKLRSAILFPKGESVSMPTLGKIGSEAGIEFQRGRVNPITTKSQRQAVCTLVQEYGAVEAATMLMTGNGGDVFKGEEISVCPATLRTIATEEGGELKRGRRAVAA